MEKKQYAEFWGRDYQILSFFSAFINLSLRLEAHWLFCEWDALDE